MAECSCSICGLTLVPYQQPPDPHADCRVRERLRALLENPKSDIRVLIDSHDCLGTGSAMPEDCVCDGAERELRALLADMKEETEDG